MKLKDFAVTGKFYS